MSDIAIELFILIFMMMFAGIIIFAAANLVLTMVIQKNAEEKLAKLLSSDNNFLYLIDNNCSQLEIEYHIRKYGLSCLFVREQKLIEEGVITTFSPW